MTYRGLDHWITTGPESSEPAHECVACGHRDSEARMVYLPSLNPSGVEWWCAECAWYQEWVCAQALLPDGVSKNE